MMTPEFDSMLRTRHPRIFDTTGDVEQRPFTTRGVECADGWFDLIDALCESLQMATDYAGDHQVVAVQVKEKMGGLRFYVSNASDRQRGMIDMATAMSSRLCEQCGGPGQTVDASGRVMTRCAAHLPNGATIRKGHPHLSTRPRDADAPSRTRIDPMEGA